MLKSDLYVIKKIFFKIFKPVELYTSVQTCTNRHTLKDTILYVVNVLTKSHSNICLLNCNRRFYTNSRLFFSRKYVLKTDQNLVKCKYAQIQLIKRPETFCNELTYDRRRYIWLHQMITLAFETIDKRDRAIKENICFLVVYINSCYWFLNNYLMLVQILQFFVFFLRH